MNYYVVVTIISILICCGVLFWIRYSFKKHSSSSRENVIIANCPDYWIDTKGDGTECVSTGANITQTCTGTMNFSGNSCDKLNKVLPCTGMVWDGITYGTGSISASKKHCILNPSPYPVSPTDAPLQKDPTNPNTPDQPLPIDPTNTSTTDPIYQPVPPTTTDPIYQPLPKM